MKLRTAIYVGRRKPISDLPPEQQAAIRKAYEDTGWASDFSVESIAILTGKGAEQRAIKACQGRPGWFYSPLPENQLLPEETADFQGCTFVNSDQPALLLNARVVNLNDPVQATEVAVEAVRRASEEQRRENKTLLGLVGDE